MTLKNKTIVITGASKGLGRSMALHFARQGANLILVARTEHLLAQLHDEIETDTGKAPIGVTCNISSEMEVQHMAATIVKKTPIVDVLINNAGFGTFRASERISNKEMRHHFEVNFFGAYYCTKALLPMLKKGSSGYILNVGSLFSKIALAENSVYAATKFALAGFSEGLRRELKPFGIGVGLFLPGAIKTTFHAGNESSSIKAPQSLLLDPQKVAAKLETMIRRQLKQVVFPTWMLPAVKLRYCRH